MINYFGGGWRWLAAGLLTLGLGVFSSAPVLADNSFSGQAVVVSGSVTTPVGTIPLDISDTGPLPAKGGSQQASLLSASVPGLLSAEVLHASAIAQGNKSRAEASVANLALAVAGQTITAGFLMSHATATCTNGAASVSGSSQIASLAVNGMPITVSGMPNQTVTVGPVTLIINEQHSSVSGNTGTITVNALHVIVPGVANVVISSSHADIVCAGNNCVSATGDFVTGGGWIPLPSGAKGTFGVAGGFNGFGHLEYIDHGTGMNVHGTGVTSYVITGTQTRHIEGTATVNGQSGFTYAVDVKDDDAGGVDAFAIRLSTGYVASNNLGGGEIQLHKANCQT